MGTRIITSSAYWGYNDSDDNGYYIYTPYRKLWVYLRIKFKERVLILILAATQSKGLFLEAGCSDCHTWYYTNLLRMQIHALSIPLSVLN